MPRLATRGAPARLLEEKRRHAAPDKAACQRNDDIGDTRNDDEQPVDGAWSRQRQRSRDWPKLASFIVRAADVRHGDNGSIDRSIPPEIRPRPEQRGARQ